MVIDLFKTGVEITSFEEELVGKEISYIKVEDEEVFIVTKDSIIFHSEFYRDYENCLCNRSYSVEDYCKMFELDDREDIREMLLNNYLVNYEAVEQLEKIQKEKKLKQQRKNEEREYQQYLKLKAKYEGDNNG